MYTNCSIDAYFVFHIRKKDGPHESDECNTDYTILWRSKKEVDGLSWRPHHPVNLWFEIKNEGINYSQVKA